MARVPQVIVFERVREVYDFMISDSKQTKDIVHFFSEKWAKDGVFHNKTTQMSKHRTIFNYIKKAKGMFFNFEKEVDMEKGRTLARLDDLYAKATKVQDSLAIIREIREIVGLTAPKESKIDMKVLEKLTYEDFE